MNSRPLPEFPYVIVPDPAAVALFNCSTPAFRFTPPPNVFAPPSTHVFVPAFVTDTVPAPFPINPDTVLAVVLVPPKVSTRAPAAFDVTPFSTVSAPALLLFAQA